MNIDLPPDILTYTLLMLALLAVYHNMIILPMYKKLQATRAHMDDEHFTVESPKQYSHPQLKRRLRKKVPMYSEELYGLRKRYEENKSCREQHIGRHKNNRPVHIKKKKATLAANVNPNNIDNRLHSCKSTVNSLEDKRTEIPKYNSYEYIEQDVEYNPCANAYHASQQEYSPPQSTRPTYTPTTHSPEYYAGNSDDSDSEEEIY